MERRDSQSFSRGEIPVSKAVRVNKQTRAKCAKFEKFLKCKLFLSDYGSAAVVYYVLTHFPKVR
jgi:hypothetical protein